MLIDSEDQDRALFDQMAIKYARKDLTPSSSWARKYQLLFAVSPLVKKNGHLGNVLEVACGCGAASFYLSGLYKNYLGLDYSQELITIAKQRYGYATDANVDFLTANIKDQLVLEKLKEKADVILIVGGLHHMTDLPQVFKSLKLLAKPGAYLVVVEPQRSNPLIQLVRGWRKKIDKNYSADQCFFSPVEVIDLFQSAGLSEVDLRHQGFFSPPLAQIIMKPQFIFAPLSRFFVALDCLLDRFLPPALKAASWNVAVSGRFE